MTTIPIEPTRMPTVSEDDYGEESFVVLACGSIESIDVPASPDHTSSGPDAGAATSSRIDAEIPLGNNIIENAESLINMELRNMAQVIANNRKNINNSSSLGGDDMIDHLNGSTSEQLSHDEIQTKLEMVLNENVKLKDKVIDNNLKMKALRERIVKWQDDVKKVNEDHIIKYAEAKKYSEKLQADNKKFLDELVEYKNIKGLLEEEIVNLKGNFFELDQNKFTCLISDDDNELTLSRSQIKIELDQANEKINELQMTIKELTSKNDAEKAKEIIDYQEQIESLTNQLGLIKIRANDFEQDLLKEKDINKKSLKQLEIIRQKYDEKVNELQMKIKELTSKNDSEKDKEIIDYQEQIESLTNQLALINIRANDFEQDLLKEMDINKENLKQLELLRPQYNELNQENKKLMKDLDENKIIYDQIKSELHQQKTIASENESKLTDIIKQLKDELNDESEKNKNQSDSDAGTLLLLRQQLMASQITITELQQQISNTIDTSKKDDEIFALQSQLAVYKADFDAERSARETVQAERDQIAEDLRNLHRRNRQLHNDIELARDRDFVVCPSQSGSGTTVNQIYSCPKCHVHFSNYQTLENHVHRCLNLDRVMP